MSCPPIITSPSSTNGLPDTAGSCPGRQRSISGFIHRDFRDRTALVEENAIYDGNKFIGFRNENQNEIFLVTSNEWNRPVYNALELVATRRTGQLQLLAGYTRVWSHLAGTWQPNDPASFIQPNAFELDRGLPSNDNRNGSVNNWYGPAPIPWSGPEWMDHVANLSGAFHGPWGMLVASSYSMLKGWWSGPILRNSEVDPQYTALRRSSWQMDVMRLIRSRLRVGSHTKHEAKGSSGSPRGTT